MNVVIALGLVALGMCIDAMYQQKIRVAECDAYETGYKQGLWENTIRNMDSLPDVPEEKRLPSMAAPVEMPPTFEERLRTHGRAVAKLK